MSEENAKSQKLGISLFMLDPQLELALPRLSFWHVQIYKYTSQMFQQQSTTKQDGFIQLLLLFAVPGSRYPIKGGMQ